MKVGILHNSLNSVGGGERVCLAIIEALKDQGFDVVLATVEPTDWSRVEGMVRKVTKPDIEMSLLPFKVRMFGIYMRLLTYRYARELRNMCDLVINSHGDVLPIKSDITYMHFPTFTLLKEQPVNIKYSKSLFWKAYFTPYERIQSFLVRRYLKSGRILTNSHYSADVIEKYTGERAQVVYPPAEVEVFQHYDDEREDLVISCGRFSPEKNFEFLLKVADKLPNVSFSVIGASSGRVSSSYYQKLLRLKERRRLDNVLFLRNLPLKSQIEIYKKAKVYLHCMIGEHLGISIVEGMASGLTPVVHKSGGPWLDVIRQGEYGFGYETLDECVRGIKKALDQSDKRRETVIEASKKFSKEIFKRNFLKVVSET